jgi:hypothetical protein
MRQSRPCNRLGERWQELFISQASESFSQDFSPQKSLFELSVPLLVTGRIARWRASVIRANSSKL